MLYSWYIESVLDAETFRHFRKYLEIIQGCMNYLWLFILTNHEQEWTIKGYIPPHMIVHSYKSRADMNYQRVHLTTFDRWFLRMKSGNQQSKVVKYTLGYFIPATRKRESSSRLPKYETFWLYLTFKKKVTFL